MINDYAFGVIMLCYRNNVLVSEQTIHPSGYVHFPGKYRKPQWLKSKSLGFIQNPERDTFFPLFIRKEIKTRKSEKKLKQ